MGLVALVWLSACGGEGDNDAGREGDGGPVDGATPVCDQGIPSAGGCRCVDGSYWELSFDSDPTDVDLDADGTPDWRMRDGEPFASSELSDGVWTSDGRTLDTNPDARFDVSTSVHLRYRSTTSGSPGAVFWINTAPAAGRLASIHADLSLQDNGTQTLVVSGRDATGDVELARFTDLGAGMVDLWLELDPETSSLTVWLEGERQGRYLYPTTDGEPADAFASLLGWGSRAEFDFVRIESCPDGAATPDRVDPPTCADTGGVMCGDACVNPLSDGTYCGATGDCAGANAGTTCDPAETCRDGACTATEPRPTPDLIVSLDGMDTATCGPPTAPCRTVEYAVESRATTGQLVGIMPGTYDETGSIAVAPSVSITGLGTDAREVVLRPNYDIGYDEFFVQLVSAELSQPGDQSVSYITFEGHAPSYTGRHIIQVQNRNDVRIHHCRFTNWDLEFVPYWNSRVIDVTTTYDFREDANRVRQAYPDDDLGPPGDYSAWTTWPTDPVTNFEFDNNYVYRCSSSRRIAPGVEPSVRPGWAVNLVNLKDSQIHHNEFDLRGLYSSAIKGIGGYWDNVDVHDNVLRSTDAFTEGWMMDEPPWKDSFVLEVWAHINGCEYYNNISNDGFSIMGHKDGAIHHNILVRDQNYAIGIETGGMHYSSVHHNYIVGGNGMGIATQFSEGQPHRQAAIYDNILIGIRNWGISLSMNIRFCRGAGVSELFAYHNIVDTSLWGSLRFAADCQTRTAPVDAYVRNNIFIGAGPGWAGINYELGPTFTALNATVENNILYGNSAGPGATCRCIDTDNGTVTCQGACGGRDPTNTINESPAFVSPDIVIVNDDDSAATDRRGTWEPAPSSDRWRYRDDAVVHGGGEGDYFEFSASGLPTDTPTFVAIWWPRGEGRASAVPITVYDGDGTTPVATYEVDQASWDSSEWYYLGMHTFASGRSRVRVNSVAGAQVVADAVLFSKLGRGYELQPGSPAIDRGSAATASVVTTDFFGNPIPSGSAPDIGVHER